MGTIENMQIPRSGDRSSWRMEASGMGIKRQQDIVSAILAVVLCLFFLYAFWFQYVFVPISMVFFALGGACFFLSLCKIRKSWKYYNDLIVFFGFIFYLLLFGLLVSYGRGGGVSYLISILKYSIPMVAMYAYIGSDWKKFFRTLDMLTATITLLALSGIVNGHRTNTGAIVAGTLNANVEASFLTIGAFSALILCSSGKTRKSKRILLLGCLILMAKAQVDCASRRGVVVLLCLLAGGLWINIQTRYKHNKLLRRMLLIAGSGMVFVSVIMLAYTLQDSVMITRLLTVGSLGDKLRVVYQKKAMELFLRSPLFGMGLGCMAEYAGMYSHSLYYELLACTGVIGTGIVVATLLSSVRRFYKYAMKFPETEKDFIIMAKFFLLFTVSILLSGLVLVYIYDMYFYVMLGLLASAQKILRENLKRIKFERIREP